MARKTKQEQLREVHTRAMERFKDIEDRERSQRELAIEDMIFANAEDGQWDEDAVAKRVDRPRYTVNRVAGAISQITGDQRQVRTDIKIKPVSGGADEDKANIYSGLIRNIESQSKSKNAYDQAFDEQVTCGYGGWRVITEFNDNDSFEQDIKIMPIRSAASSLYFDPAAIEYDKRDSSYAFYITSMNKAEFKQRFPQADMASFTQRIRQSSLCSGWFSDDLIRVAEYWEKKPVTKRIGLLSDGRVIDLDKEKDVIDELADSGIVVEKTRTVETFEPVMYLMNGVEVLDDPKSWAGTYIPLVPVYGKVSNVEGKEYVRGLVRFAKDPSRIYNYATSAAIEAAALAPKDPIWITAKQAKGHTDRLSTFNVRNDPFLFYNSDPETPGPPQRSGAPAVQTALIQQVQQAAQDIHATTGLEPASLGNVPELKSGKAIQAQQAMGDRGSFIFTDNLKKSIEYTGEVLLDLIPNIYDTERVVRVLNVDGSSRNEVINLEAIDNFGQTVVDEETGKPVMVNDITDGKYAVVVNSGPSFSTQRQESAQQLIDLANGNETIQALAMDLIAKNLDVLEADELTKRVRRSMIQQGLVEPTEDEIEELGLNQPSQPDPGQLAIVENVQMQTADLQSKIEERDSKTDLNILSAEQKRQEGIIDAQSKAIDTYKTLVDAYQAQIDAGIPLGTQEHDARIKQLDVVAEGQQAVDPGPNSEQAQDLINRAGQSLPLDS